MGKLEAFTKQAKKLQVCVDAICSLQNPRSRIKTLIFHC